MQTAGKPGIMATMKPSWLVLLLLAALGLALGLLSRRPPPPLLAGQVRDVDGPVAAARVRYKGTAQSTHTDHAGRFVLPRSSNRVTAWKEGYFIAGGRSPLLHLEPLPHDDHEHYAWVDPTPHPGDEQRCGNCHRQTWREWSVGGHARSATSKHFRNLYDGSDWHGAQAGWSLLAEYPDGAGVCSSCHAPTVRDDDPALFDLRKAGGVDALGVHCDYCHKVAGAGDGPVGLAHGRFALRLLRPRTGQLFFGPLDDVDRGEDTFSPFQRDSRFCASCHEGVVFGVPVYTTYSEWRDSPARRAGRHCQHCHMKPTGTLHNVAPGHGGIDRDPNTLGNHVFWDGSQLAMLRRCLKVDVETSRQDNGVAVVVRLTARGVGHRVPTGFVDRQVLLVVDALDQAGRAVPLACGPTLPPAAGPILAGHPGRLYARLLKDEAGRSPVPFWRALPDPVDTRLVPEQADVRRFLFAPPARRVRVRVLHRRFWAETARGKRWPDSDLVVVDTGRDVGPRPTR
jgi:hypothetical protein